MNFQGQHIARFQSSPQSCPLCNPYLFSAAPISNDVMFRTQSSSHPSWYSVKFFHHVVVVVFDTCLSPQFVSASHPTVASTIVIKSMWQQDPLKCPIWAGSWCEHGCWHGAHPLPLSTTSADRILISCFFLQICLLTLGLFRSIADWLPLWMLIGHSLC